MARWLPPLPQGIYYNKHFKNLGPAIPLLFYLYDLVQRDGSVAFTLTQAAQDLDEKYPTVKRWWQAIRVTPIIAEATVNGRGGLRATFAPAWLDWRMPKRGENGPETGSEVIPFEETGQKRDENGIRTDPVSSEPSEKRDENGTKTGSEMRPFPLHVGTQENQSGSNDDDDMTPRAREAPAPEGRRSSSSNPPAARVEAGDEAPEPLPQGTNTPLTEGGAPQPPVAAAPLPPAVLSETRTWLGREPNGFERKLLLSLLAKYDTSLVLEGIAHAAANGARSVNYVIKTLAECTAAGRRPSDPKTTTGDNANGTHHPPGSRSRGPSRRPVSPPLDEATIARYRAAPKLGDVHPELRGVPGRPDRSGSSD